jgi:hypothetical protein
MFNLQGLTVHLESDKEHGDIDPSSDEMPFPIHIDIKSIDAIWNPEYEKL